MGLIAMGRLEHRQGKYQDALKKVELRRLLASAGDNAFPARLLPQLMVIAGDTEGLFQYLEKAFEARDPLLPGALTDPVLDAVRAIPAT